MSCTNNLKQIGLALHNYHDTNNAFPPYGYDFTSNPRPANPYGNQTQGHSVFTLLLPYLEQQNVINIAFPQYSVIDPMNMPPNYGTSIAGLTKVKTYLCPSAPARTVDYGPYFATQGLALGTLNLGYTDYAPTAILQASFIRTCAPVSPSGNVGALGQKGQFNPGGGMTTGITRMADMTDGTSNTLMISEDAGRQQVYANGKPLSPNGPGQVGYALNAAWADYNIRISVIGYDSTGTVPGGGCCVINCSNNSQVYAFHPGGANAVRGDGSVHFMTQNTSAPVFAAMFTRAGGEVFQDNQ
jgi:hypothetical protein